MNSLFSIRIVAVDSYIAKPTPNLDTTYSEFRKKDVASVPVIRVFGSTLSGQCVCLNIHGVFPYLMVPYHGPSWKDGEVLSIQQYLDQFAASLDHALNSSASGKTKFNNDHVFKISIVRAKPFYGYHAKDEVFMKVYFYSPSDIKRASDLLQAGAIMNSSFQPHEAHIPYILQMFLDYNLYGMNLLHANSCRFRQPVGKDDRFRVVPKTAQRKDDKKSNNDKEKDRSGAADSSTTTFDWNNLRKSESHSTATNEDNSGVPQGSVEGTVILPTAKPVPKTSCTQVCVASLRRSLSNSSEVFQSSSSSSKHCPLHTRWQSDNIPADAFLAMDIAPKQTSCEIEVDILAADILNRKELEQSGGRNPGITAIWEDEKARRRARSDSSLIELPSSAGDRNEGLTNKEEENLKNLKQSLDECFPDLSPESTDKMELDVMTNSFISENVPALQTTLNRQRSSSNESARLSNKSERRRVSFESTPPSTDSFLMDLIELDAAANTSVEKILFRQNPSDSSIRLENRRVSFESNTSSGDSFIRGMMEAKQTNSLPIVDELIVSQVSSPDEPWTSNLNEVEKMSNVSSLASQHSNGLVDDVSDSDADSDVTLIQPSKRSDHHSSDLLDSNESFAMSQPWESGIEDLMLEYHSDDDDTVIPQLDGKSDDVIESSPLSEPSTRRSARLKKRKIPTLPSTFPQDNTRAKQTPPVNQSVSSNNRPARKSLKIRKHARLKHSSNEKPSPEETRPVVKPSTRTAVIKQRSDSEGLVKLKAFLPPPSWEDAQEFMKSSRFKGTVEESKEPFYSNSADVQPSTSTRSLTNFPTCNKKSSSNSGADEYVSAEFSCGIKHWKFIASTIPSDNTGQTEDNFLSDLATSLQRKDDTVVIKPLLPPPCPAKVWKWAEKKRRRKETKSVSSENVALSTKTPSKPVVDNALAGVTPITADQESTDADRVAPKLTVDNFQTPLSSNLKRSSAEARIATTSTPLVGNNRLAVPHKKLFEASSSVNPSQEQDEVSVIPSSQDTQSSGSSHTLHLQSPQDVDILAASNVVGIKHNTFAFRASQRDLGEAKVLHETQHIKSMSMELHVRTRLELCPDPEIDEIRALFYAFQSDSSTSTEKGCFIIDSQSSKQFASMTRCGITDVKTVYVDSEADLFNHLATLVTKHDPDILMGYEVQMLSWGYLLSRAAHLSYDLCRYLSRVPPDSKNNWCSAEKDEFGADNSSEIHIVGRLVLNIWRLMRSEVALYDYKFESVAYHLLHQRHPRYSPRTLTLWFDQPQSILTTPHHQSHTRARVVKYLMCRVLGNLQLISQQDMIGRTSELARLFGIQFYEVLTRGSQFRVESMMLRQAHSLNYVAVSPSPLQRASQKAPECIALVMEPESRFYSEPVIVVDFQSLYPSMIIAYNYCFSTCLGRIKHLKTMGNTPFGCTSLDVPVETVKRLLRDDNLHVAPNSVAYVKANVRRGVLPAMLEEILNTRIMVKDSMKKCDDKSTKQMLDHRQLGLKLIANVTYGYTGASFSGRMACVEVADSIVNKARETLERAIELVRSNWDRWEGRVVYGDTDSMFIALKKGTSKKRAFQVGREIIEAVTKSNPRPVKLKLEKIYQPCILQTKKRYVGYAYESEDQVEPMFDAKGIETVRRDGCPAVAKILEKSLRILFDTRDVSQVKQYVSSECGKIMNDGNATLQDCIIAKEYRGSKYYKHGVLVPALVLARKQLALDKRAEPRSGERVPYVVVHGAPGTPLYQLIRHPKDVITDVNSKLNGAYYVTKMVLPALDRAMSLLGVDVFQWYQQLPRELRICVKLDDSQEMEVKKKATLSQYFSSRHCLSCKSLCTSSICDDCLRDASSRQKCAIKINGEIANVDRKLAHIYQICSSCSNSASSSDIKCESLDCPVFYKRIRIQHDASRSRKMRRVLASNDLF